MRDRVRKLLQAKRRHFKMIEVHEAAADHPSYFVVSFAREDFPADYVERIAALHDGPERLAVVGRELFTDFPHGQAESKLIQAMAKLRPVIPMTGRNWNTVRKLADML